MSFAVNGVDSNCEHERVPVLLSPAPFIKGAEFWCNRCDGGPVKSDDPSTGLFFSVFGHNWIPSRNDRPGKLSDEYTQVIFAVCRDCLELARK